MLKFTCHFFFKVEDVSRCVPNMSVCVCMRASDLHQIRCCPGCFHNAFLQLYSWYGEQKSRFIVIRNSYGFRYVQNKIKQQKQNTHRHKPHTHPKPKKNKNTKPSHGFYKTQKLLILAVQLRCAPSTEAVKGLLFQKKKK